MSRTRANLSHGQFEQGMELRVLDELDAPDGIVAYEVRDSDDETFVQETDFDDSYLLVVVAAAWPSGYWLELGAIDRRDDGLGVGIDTASPEGPVGDGAAVHSLAIRITDERDGVPERVGIEIGGERTGTATRN